MRWLPDTSRALQLIWIGAKGPAALATVGVIAVVVFYRRRGAASGAAGAPPPLSEAEKTRLAGLLEDDPR